MTDPGTTRRRVLLDENLPRQLAGELPAHDVATVRTQGWTGIVNGKLLSLAEASGFQVFVTADRNLEYQQSLAGRAFGVVVVLPRRLKMEYLLPLIPALNEAVGSIEPGAIVHVKPLSW
jgi:hypothetical protein